MFEYLAPFNKVVVTGPQRSGTTICSHMIANDTGMTLVEEGAYQVHIEDRFMFFVDRPNRCVIHAPAMMHLIPKYGWINNLAVVVMMRDEVDIIASQKRIGWVHEHKALAPYGLKVGDGWTQSGIKYHLWDSQYRILTVNSFEVQYESLANHFMWVPKERRKKFHAKQTAL